MGETVEIRDSHGRFLAWGAYNPESQIRLRVWSWNQQISVGPDHFRDKLIEAIDHRMAMFVNVGQVYQTADGGIPAFRSLPPAIRLVNAESDGLPGLIVDRYGDTLVLQFLCAGVEHWRQTFVELLAELTNIEHIYEP